MLPRTPEPEVMDDAQQALAYARADFAEPNQRVVDELLSRAPGLSGRLLDLGCGPADVPIRLAGRCPELRITALDASEAMLQHARSAVREAKLDARIELVHGRLPEALPTDRPFDAVISNSLLHHLPDGATLWRCIRRAAAPGAMVWVVDLYRPPDDGTVEQLVAAHAGGEPAILQRDFRASLHAAFRPEEIRAQLEAEGLAGLRVERLSDRHVAVSGRL